jgi:hypothetical protein
LVPNSSQNCSPKYYTKLARLPSGQSQTKGRKTKKLKRKGAQFFCKVSSLWADSATQEEKQGVQETKTRRKTGERTLRFDPWNYEIYFY